MQRILYLMFEFFANIKTKRNHWMQKPCSIVIEMYTKTVNAAITVPHVPAQRAYENNKINGCFNFVLLE